MNRIAERFHGQGSLLKAGQIEEVRDRAQTDDQVIVWNLVVVMIEPVRDGHELPVEIDRFNLPGKKIDSLEELSYRIHNVREIEIAGGDFVQQRSKQKEVVPVHQRDFDTGIARQGVIQMNGGVQSGKAAAENENPSFLLLSHKSPPVNARYSSATSQKTLIEPFGFVSLLKSSV